MQKSFGFIYRPFLSKVKLDNRHDGVSNRFLSNNIIGHREVCLCETRNDGEIRYETEILLAGSRSINVRERIVSPDKTIKHSSEFWEYKRTILYERLSVH